MDKCRVSEYGTNEVREVLRVGRSPPKSNKRLNQLTKSHSLQCTYSTELARTNAVKVAVGVDLPAATE